MTTIRLALICFLILPANAFAVPANIDDGLPGERVGMADVAGGALLVAVDDADRQYVPLPGLRTDIDIGVEGIAARVEITQVFHNPSTRWLEAVYVFPLPENSAVTRLRMTVADRVIEGVVKEKREARRRYNQARAQGKKAALVEQQRPNLFTSSVANIPPGESIEISLTYFESVGRTDDTYHLRVPLVAGPRYLPPASDQSDRTGNTGGDDPQPLSNPNTIPPGRGKVNPVTLSFDVDAGFKLEAVTSPYHRIDVSRPAASRATGRLTGGDFADRDFELRWQPVAGHAPKVAVFVDRRGAESYVLLMLQPPLPDTGAPAAARELILVIDASGSMHGPSIEQAVSAARFALSTLSERDQFNLIRFSDRASMLFPSPQPAGPAALVQAEQFLSRIEANGGTNMAAALQRAFNNPVTRDLLRQIVFLTDGAVGNEAALFAMIDDGTRSSRLFTVGIGSAPNSYFMRRAARTGRGTHTFIGRAIEVETRMAALFERIRKPALTDIDIDWRGTAIEPGLSRVPDLYYGEPLTLTAHLTRFRGLTLSGRYDGVPWRHEVNDGDPPSSSEIATLWAREQIARLKDDLLGGGDREVVKQRITRIGLEHQLVTPYTSLVAVERRVTRPGTDPLYRSNAPVNLPHGWSYRHVFGSLPQTGTGWRIQLGAGLGLLALGLLLWYFGRVARCSPASS